MLLLQVNILFIKRYLQYILELFQVWTVWVCGDSGYFVSPSTQHPEREDLSRTLFLVILGISKIIEDVISRFVLIFVGTVLALTYWGLHWSSSTLRLKHLKSHVRVNKDDDSSHNSCVFWIVSRFRSESFILG